MQQFIKYSPDKIKGILLGTFIGDAIGSNFIGQESNHIPPLDFQYIIDHPPKTYTDDTQMTISVFEEMVENGYINSESLANRVLQRFNPWRGYSGGMLEVIEKWRDGQDIQNVAGSLYNGTGSFGNGAAMRVAPISAFFLLNEVELMAEQVKASSLLTHTHPYGVDGAILQSLAVLLALNDVPTEKWIKYFLSVPIDSAFKIKFEKVIKCLERRSTSYESAMEIGNGSDALGSVSAAIYSVMRNEESFCDSVLFAVSMGGDTDTIGAMAGSIAGAKFGYNEIPLEWLRNLEDENEGKTFIEGLIKKAYEKRRGEDSNLR